MKIGQTIDIQIAVAYYDSFGSEKMRIYNYTLTSTDDVNKLYPAGNPWTFSDNIRRALGYYTVAERDLAARLN